MNETATTIAHGRELARRITTELRKRVVGQDEMIERLLIGLLAGGHVLLEGVPGLAKTLTVRSLADTLQVGGISYSAELEFSEEVRRGENVTNKATLKGWHWQMVISDTLWGAVLTAISAWGAAALFTRWVSRCRTSRQAAAPAAPYHPGSHG